MVTAPGKAVKVGCAAFPLMPSTPVVSKLLPNRVVRPRGPASVLIAPISRMAFSYSKPDSFPI
ncbi:hypothetical protein D3C73_1591600 [compost metagenome]